MTIHVDINPSHVDFQQLRDLLSDSGWGAADFYTDAVLEKMVKGCSYFLVAQDANNLTGHTAVCVEALVGTEGFNESLGITKSSTLVACSRKPFIR